MEIVTIAFDHPDAQQLIAEVQQEYVVRYGEPDATPVDPGEFAPPGGYFVVGYLHGTPIACGGWRAHDGPAPEFRPGDAEIKRMYVAASARGNGFARELLAELERSARAAGRTRMVLETGTVQPEAIGLYRSTGYTPIPNFGHYRDHEQSVCFGKDLTAAQDSRSGTQDSRSGAQDSRSGTQDSRSGTQDSRPGARDSRVPLG